MTFSSFGHGLAFDVPTKEDRTMVARNIAAITAFADAIEQFFVRQDKAMANLQQDMEGIKKELDDLNNTPPVLTVDDQSRLDRVIARVSAFSDKLDQLDAMTPPPAPPVEESTGTGPGGRGGQTGEDTSLGNTAGNETVSSAGRSGSTPGTGEQPLSGEVARSSQPLGGAATLTGGNALGSTNAPQPDPNQANVNRPSAENRGIPTPNTPEASANKANEEMSEADRLLRDNAARRP